MGQFNKYFINANKKKIEMYLKINVHKLANSISKSVQKCTDTFSLKQGKKYTVYTINTGGVIGHFKNMKEVKLYLAECAIVRSWID